MNVRNKECQVTMWLPRLNLQIKDKVDLETDSSWLNDRHMNAAQKLLHEQFPTVSGLADTVLSQGKWKYDPTNAVQILHMRENHWVCVSTMAVLLILLMSMTACTVVYQPMVKSSWQQSSKQENI